MKILEKLKGQDSAVAIITFNDNLECEISDIQSISESANFLVIKTSKDTHLYPAAGIKSVKYFVIPF